MELIIQILLLFIFINTILKLSFWKWWQSAVFSLCCGVFVLFTYPYAIAQSKTVLLDYLNNNAIMQDLAVLVTIESALCISFCFAVLLKLFGQKSKRWIKPLYWYPSLLIFPALFYILTSTIFSMPGTDFKKITYIIAAGIFILLPLLSSTLKLLLPEKELRLETHFLVSLFVTIIGLISTVNGNITYAAVQQAPNTKAIITALVLFIALFTIGALWNKYKWQLKRNKTQ